MVTKQARGISATRASRSCLGRIRTVYNHVWDVYWVYRGGEVVSHSKREVGRFEGGSSFAVYFT
jgi:hypothetical protein